MAYIADSLRHLVRERAHNRCEYCLLHEQYTVKRHEIDHIYAEKHGGETIESNLCLSCLDCNRYKGSDLASIDPDTGEIVPLFHPRRSHWAEHFENHDGYIQPLTATGRVTVRLLRFNTDDRTDERARLTKLNRYP
jgi:hypothetical protein